MPKAAGLGNHGAASGQPRAKPDDRSSGRSRVCSASFRYAPCCAAPGTHSEGMRSITPPLARCRAP